VSENRDFGQDTDYDVNSVLFFQMKYGKNLYSYAALKTSKNGGWYLTGKETEPMNFQQLCNKFLYEAHTVSYAPSWEKLV
jgi:hypothetical protein